MSLQYKCTLTKIISQLQSRQEIALFAKLQHLKYIDRIKIVGTVEYADCISAEGYDSLPSKECSGYDTKLSDGEAAVLELWGMWSTTSLLLLPGSL